ncbi:MAG: Lar family restriction alleviation protein [Ruminococcus sp.]
MNTEKELKPCPFCGSIPIINEIPPHKHFLVDMPDYEGACFVECSCSCAITADTREEAIEKWNRRADNGKL